MTLNSYENLVEDLYRNEKRDKILANELLDYYIFHYLGLDVPPHQESWIHHLESDEDLLVLAPRDHGKTTVFCRAYPEHQALVNPNMRILILSKTHRQAEKTLDLIEQDLQGNPLIQRDYYDELRDYHRKDNMLYFNRTEAQRDATIEAAGLLGAITGSHFDLIIADDLIDDESTRTKQRMDNVHQWFQGTVEPLLEPWGRMIIVGTRKHYNDLYGRLIDSDAYTVIHDKAICADGKPLWPERWPLEKLEEKKRKMGTVMFNREYQNDPTGLQGQLLREEWIQYYDTPPEDLRVYQGLDLAISQSETADYTVCTTIGVTEEGEDVYVLDWYRARVDFPTQVRMVCELADRYQPLVIGVEDVAYQRALPQAVLRRRRLPLRPLRPDGDKTRRILSSFIAFENGKVYLPRGHRHLGDFIDEYLQFDRGEHDDMLDSLCIALRASETGRTRIYIPRRRR